MSYPPERIRNFALVGHQSAGKTSLAEAMLACAGAIDRMGTVEAGNTVSDYHATEKERQISVHASLLHCDWQGTKYNIIDTPGYLDFISEGLGALRVGDFAMVVVNALSGPEIGTDQVWDYANQFQLPKLIVVNGIDKDNVDFDATLAELRAHYGRKVFPMTLPIDPGPGCRRILDVLRSEEVDYAGDASGKYTETPAQGPWKERVRKLHAELVELVAEADDTLMEEFFDQGDLTEEQLRSGVHKAIQAETFIPVFATSATTNVGVARLMDLISKYGSSPLDRKIVPAIDEEGHRGDIALSDSNPACYIWKTISEPHVGELSFCRMYSGSIHPNMELLNPFHGTTEKIGQIFTLQGHQRQAIPEIGPGDIGVMAKLKDTHTGNTLTSLERKVRLPAVQYPHPNIHGALVALHKGDEDKLAAGLATLHEEDPTFLFGYNAETHELVVSGQGELHLEVIKSRLARRFNVEVDIVEPRVPFRETIQSPAEAKYRHKKQSGGAGQFAEVWLRIRPTEPGAGIQFSHSLTGNNVDRVFVPSVEKGVHAACEAGIHAGYPITDVAIDFYDGKMHTVDSKDIAFQTAGREAFTEAFKNARPILLEPILSIEVKVPEQYLGDVMSDLSARRGHIHGIEGETKYRTIKAEVPQMEMYRYATTLRSLTGGVGLHSETFARYDPLPSNLETRVLKQPELAATH
ncbi:elongation factor G [Pelagicoccus sp. SDUM812005]|uniref:elongation factor G n=1 Tax=Pelagicoccus sp. SDUM812005 TaxID=3041257 RepID=UPI00280D8CDD|nr:elongation factor G [Pelagicoccus sp. SDUM812005]MDQ8182780.1 elongation factor G [Pelagicoccus sp. SDUM812005]